MEFNKRAFFAEKAETNVQGFIVIETSESGPGYGEPSYRMAEKWNRADGDSMWVTYWIPAETLNARIERGDCAYAKDVSETQFKGVLNLAEVAEEVENARRAAA